MPLFAFLRGGQWLALPPDPAPLFPGEGQIHLTSGIFGCDRTGNFDEDLGPVTKCPDQPVIRPNPFE
eukprot:CAMPEP_0181293164 /NCGR_PEP_ID=MMETSP1101-20121128/2914_1 /TAXON_ID=46948 /ORGANISM="Rhodomonas abbreviata, Strain Caron Lab Isolate" /LENGTH=66 /DNA_ID=CAMNT_0023397723 /DNA_START=8 /DNA_END=208 /DNA_ORIENTATION=-